MSKGQGLKIWNEGDDMCKYDGIRRTRITSKEVDIEDILANCRMKSKLAIKRAQKLIDGADDDRK